MAKYQLRSMGGTLAALDSSAQTVRDEFQTLQQEVTGPVVLRALTLGFVGGLRSTAPLALLDWTRKQNPEPTNEFEQFMDSSASRVLISSIAAGELVGDKLPAIPSRLSPAPLAGRLGLGALAGASIFRRHRQPLVVGAVLGALGAGAGAVAGYYIRDALTTKTQAPQWMLGVAEDALAFGLGFLAVKKD